MPVFFENFAPLYEWTDYLILSSMRYLTPPPVPRRPGPHPSPLQHQPSITHRVALGTLPFFSVGYASASTVVSQPARAPSSRRYTAVRAGCSALTAVRALGWATPSPHCTPSPGLALVARADARLARSWGLALVATRALTFATLSRSPRFTEGCAPRHTACGATDAPGCTTVSVPSQGRIL